MMNKKTIFILIFGIVVGVLIFGGFYLLNSSNVGNIIANLSNSKKRITLVQPVNAAEMYEEFLCPCCGQTIETKCCEMAKERRNFVDSLIVKGNSREEIMIAFAKKYGLDSFKNEERKQELKELLAKSAPKERPKITISPSTIDLGNVSQKNSITTTFFELKNEGTKDLTINKLDTSCGCTSASIVFQGKEGPLFAMADHGAQNPTNWQITIPAREGAQLKVYYDPNVHKDLRGFVIREIYIYSNDPIDFEKKVQIELNQTN